MKTSQTNIPEYKSRDIYFSTVLKAAGISLIRVEAHNGKGFFVFQDSPEIQKIISDYSNGNFKIDAKRLFEEWKTLKGLAFSAVNGEDQNGKYYTNHNK